MMVNDPLLRPCEVADFLKVSLPTLYRRVADGTLPKPMKLGHLSRWPRSEILAAIAAVGDRRRASA